MNAGIVHLVSRHSVTETVARLEALLRAKGIKVFCMIDQAAEARSAGSSLRPTVLLILGDPKTGTPLMRDHPTLALDLPIKALVSEDAEGTVHLSYNSPQFLQERHGLEAQPFVPMIGLFQEATQKD